MSQKFVETPIEPQSSRRDIADHINRAFATSDITAICRAIGDATRLHNIGQNQKSSMRADVFTQQRTLPRYSVCPLRANRVVWRPRRSLPVFTGNQTSSAGRQFRTVPTVRSARNCVAPTLTMQELLAEKSARLMSV